MPSNKLERLVSLIFKTERTLRNQARDGGGIDPFTMIRLETIRLIATKEGTTMKDVAANLHITAPSATSLVSSLVKAGYVRRKPGRGDRRLVCLEVTAGGKRFHDEGFKTITERMKRALSRLGQDDIDKLSEVLDRLVEANGKLTASN